MADVFLSFFRSSLPDELAAVLETTIKATESGDFLKVLQLPEAQLLLGREDNEATKDVRRGDFAVWNDYIFRRLGLLLSQQNEVDSGSIQETAAYKQHTYLLIAVAALYAFLQSNVTGPPLPFKSAETLLSEDITGDVKALNKARADRVAAYRLTPNIELLCLAQTILISPAIRKNIPVAAWARLRANFVHQRLLSESAPSLQDAIYDDLKVVEDLIHNSDKSREF
jgi:hypothetical protein